MPQIHVYADVYHIKLWKTTFLGFLGFLNAASLNNRCIVFPLSQQLFFSCVLLLWEVYFLFALVPTVGRRFKPHWWMTQRTENVLRTCCEEWKRERFKFFGGQEQWANRAVKAWTARNIIEHGSLLELDWVRIEPLGGLFVKRKSGEKVSQPASWRRHFRTLWSFEGWL